MHLVTFWLIKSSSLTWGQAVKKSNHNKTISYKVTKIKFITINFSHFLRKILPYNEGTSRDVSRTAFEHPLWNLLSYNF